MLDWSPDRNGPGGPVGPEGQSGQRAEPAVTDLDRLAMNSPSGSAIPNSHDVNERLACSTDTRDAANDAEVPA